MIAPIKVLIVDDSVVVRQSIRQLLENEPYIQVMGVASDPLFAIEKIQREKPDVITLDLEMPRMDGITFFEKIMSQQPIPVVVISSFTPKDSNLAIQAYEAGAVEVMLKPNFSSPSSTSDSRWKLVNAVRAAASARINRISPVADTNFIPNHKADIIIPKKTTASSNLPTDNLVVIGASTGGTEAIRVILEAMPENCPGIVIVQHMPEVFTRSFAERLDQLCRIQVKEAVHGESIERSKAIIAPGNKHVVIRKSGLRYFVDLNDGPPVNRHRPSVDVLFRSAAQAAGKNCTGILLTGMGADGAAGLLELKTAGAYTIAQDEKSSVVFGMPQEAIKLDAALSVLGLNQIAGAVLNRDGKGNMPSSTVEK